jgi:hypothetical protein
VPAYVIYSPTYGYLWTSKPGDYTGPVVVRELGDDGREVRPAEGPLSAKAHAEALRAMFGEAGPTTERHAVVRRHLVRYARSNPRR